MTGKNRASTDDSRKTFEQLARELECDEDEERFEEQVKRVAKKPKSNTPKGESN